MGWVLWPPAWGQPGPTATLWDSPSTDPGGLQLWGSPLVTSPCVGSINVGGCPCPQGGDSPWGLSQGTSLGPLRLGGFGLIKGVSRRAPPGRALHPYPSGVSPPECVSVPCLSPQGVARPTAVSASGGGCWGGCVGCCFLPARLDKLRVRGGHPTLAQLLRGGPCVRGEV